MGTNGCHFVKNHLKSGPKCLDFEWSGFQMVWTIAITKAQPSKSPGFKCFWIFLVRFQVPTVPPLNTKSIETFKWVFCIWPFYISHAINTFLKPSLNIQWGSEIRPFEIPKPLKSRLSEGQISNGLVFKWSGFSNGYSYSPNQSKKGPFKILMFLSGFQMVFDRMAIIWLSDFRSNSNSRPFGTQSFFDQSKYRLVQILDSHCIRNFIHIICVYICILCVKLPQLKGSKSRVNGRTII